LFAAQLGDAHPDLDPPLEAAVRRSHRTADAALVVVDAVRRAELDPEQAARSDEPE
jgi:hypothetical protein